MKVVKVIASNGREMYFKVVSGKKVRISKKVALVSKEKPEPRARSKRKLPPTKKMSKVSKPKVYSVKEALVKKPLKSKILVAGYLLIEDDDFNLCEDFEETWPPGCGSRSIVFSVSKSKRKKFLEGFDGLKTDQGITWSEGVIQLRAGWSPEGKLEIYV